MARHYKLSQSVASLPNEQEPNLTFVSLNCKRQLVTVGVCHYFMEWCKDILVHFECNVLIDLLPLLGEGKKEKLLEYSTIISSKSVGDDVDCSKQNEANNSTSAGKRHI